VGTRAHDASGAPPAGLGVVRSGAPPSILALRRGVLLVAAPTALVAVLAGLARLGIDTGWGGSRAPWHGPLFVVGVFATLIGLERAVALGARWAYAAPVLGAAAAVALLGRMPIAPWIAAASTLVLIAVNIVIARRVVAGFTALMALGSIVLAGGTVAWAAGRPVFAVAPAWLAFFVLTIVAERVELSRLARVPAWAGRLVVVVGAVAAIAACAAVHGAPGATRVLGGAMVLLALWQLRFDLARRTVRGVGLPRFAAIAILSGTGWLLAAGALMAASGLPAAGPIYDAVLHAVLIGFVLAMVMAHAPIILPAVARIDVPYHCGMYAPLLVLHGGLVVRVIGDLAGLAALRQVGGVASGVALALLPLAIGWARRAARPISRIP
jgi:hypothetical protein